MDVMTGLSRSQHTIHSRQLRDKITGNKVQVKGFGHVGPFNPICINIKLQGLD